MSTNVHELDAELNQMILHGQILPAFDKFYADDVVMEENTQPFVGKELNRKREEDFMASVKEWHGVKLGGTAVEGDRSFSEWELDVTFQTGARVTLVQVAARKWKDGQIIHERFYYKG